MILITADNPKDFMAKLLVSDAFDSFYINNDLSAMEGLFAGYINTRLDTYLKMLNE